MTVQSKNSASISSRRQHREKGQVLLEFLISFIVFFFMLWALVEIAMISSTKLLTNYASWAAARAWSVNVDSGDGMQEAQGAATQVLGFIRWQTSPTAQVRDSQSRYNKPGVYVDYSAPLGIPQFLTQSTTTQIVTRGFAPMIQEPITKDNEDGDNSGK